MVYLSGLACWCWRVLKCWHMLAWGWCACQNWRGVINIVIWKLDGTGERKKSRAFPPSSVILFSRHNIHYITPILHAHHPQHFQTCQHLELSRVSTIFVTAYMSICCLEDVCPPVCTFCIVLLKSFFLTLCGVGSFSERWLSTLLQFKKR